MVRFALAIVVASLFGGCTLSRDVFVFVPCFPNCSVGLDGGESGDGGAVMTWARYTATVALPSCATGAVLTVNTTSDEIDGPSSMRSEAEAGPTLSLPEATLIAANRAGPDTIEFDRSVFDPANPATIVLSNAQPSLAPLNATCVDGRGRGVIVEWAGVGTSCPLCAARLAAGSLMIGLTLRNMPEPLYVTDSSQVAGCRLHSRATATVSLGNLSYLGPENVIDGRIGVRIDMAATTEVSGNYFGYDPVLRTTLTDQAAAETFGALLFEDNVVWSGEGLTFTGAGGNAVVRNNFFGVNRDGSPLALNGRLQKGVSFSGVGSYVFGPNNTVRHSRVGVSVSAIAGSLRVAITRNNIAKNMTGIAFAFEPVEPPQLTIADANHVEGLCTTPGLVEVFSDDGDQGESFLGQTPCNGGGEPWRLDVTVPRGRNVTATLTVGPSTSGFSAPVAVR